MYLLLLVLRYSLPFFSMYWTLWKLARDAVEKVPKCHSDNNYLSTSSVVSKKKQIAFSFSHEDFSVC